MVDKYESSNSSTYIPFQDGLLVSPPYNINEDIVEYTPFQGDSFNE